METNQREDHALEILHQVVETPTIVHDIKREREKKRKREKEKKRKRDR